MSGEILRGKLNQNGLARAAIDVDVLSSYPSTIVRGQEYHHRGNVLVGVTHSPQGVLGNQTEVFAVFDVPPDTKPTQIVLHDSAYSPGVTVDLT